MTRAKFIESCRDGKGSNAMSEVSWPEAKAINNVTNCISLGDGGYDTMETSKWSIAVSDGSHWFCHTRHVFSCKYIKVDTNGCTHTSNSGMNASIPIYLVPVSNSIPHSKKECCTRCCHRSKWPFFRSIGIKNRNVRN
eukprot:252044_1